ncbi:unnamed protein product [Paramecium sonneborni]|uniref:Uncharacterized protein n=1 Tax=Paramecium sonneborni TaxID=65129 RepID=A0A8S1JZY5_9CILI|nr:unnamed protein product [Paramecium sonneborni]
MCENYCRMHLLSQLKQKKNLEQNQPLILYRKISSIVKKAKQQAQKSMEKTQIQAVFDETRFQSSNRQSIYKQNYSKEIKYQINHQKEQQNFLNFNKNDNSSRKYTNSRIIEKDFLQNDQQYQQSPLNYRNDHKKVIIFSSRNTPQRNNINIRINFDTLRSWRRYSQDSSQ